MIKLNVKSIWHGKVGIREKYIHQANEKKEGLEIWHQGSLMEIPFDKIQEKIVTRSARPVVDKFKGEWHYLLYFTWSPSVNQTKLL